MLLCKFINDVIWVAARAAVMFLFVIAGVSIWALYRPDVRAALLTIQNEIFRMFV